MQIPLKYFVGFVIFCCALIIAPHVYSHWHFDVIDPIDLYLIDKEHYESENGCEIGFMSYSDWQVDQEKRSESFYDEIAHQICESFDPWYERNDRDISPTEANYEHGRD